MQKRLLGGGKQSDYDVSKLYQTRALFFSVTPWNLTSRTIPLTWKCGFEGKQATLNNIIINGNDHQRGGWRRR